MPYYKVIKQAIAYNGGTYYPERRAGKKVIPADIVEMDEKDAEAFGEEYLQKVKAPQDKNEQDKNKNKKDKNEQDKN